MAAPAYIGNGGIHETAVPWTTGHAAGDFGLLLVENDVDTISTPSGWTAVGSAVVFSGGNNTILQAWYQFATSGAMSAASIPASNHCSGWISTFSGVNTANPIHTRSAHVHPANTELYCPGTVTRLDNCLIVNAWSWHLDNAGPLSSGETNATLTSLTERIDGGTITGNGGGIVMVTGVKATAGLVDPTKITLSLSAAVAMRTIALQAADQTFGRNSRKINTGM